MDPFKEISSEEFAVTRNSEDQVLEPLLEEIEAIKDIDVRSFVRAILISVPEWYWTAPSSLEDDTTLEDETQKGGLIISIKRSLRTFEILAMTANLTDAEKDVGLAAIFLGCIDKYRNTDDGLKYNEWSALSACQKIDRIISFNKLWGKDGLSNTIAIGDTRIEEIKRLIRIQDGKWTVVPELRPRNALELNYHQALYIASGLKWLVDIEDKI